MQFYYVSNPMLGPIMYLWNKCMILFLAALFYGPPLHAGNKVIDFSSPNMQQLLSQVDELVKTEVEIEIGYISAAITRVIGFAYFENGVSIEARKEERKFRNELISGFAGLLKPCPDYLRTHQEIHQDHLSDMKYDGNGSIDWGIPVPQADGAVHSVFESGQFDVEQQLPSENSIGLNPTNVMWFDGVGTFSEGLAIVVVGNQYGYIDTTGKMVIRPQFEVPEGMSQGLGINWLPISFSEGLAAAAFGGKYGYINKTGEFLIDPQFDSAKAFSDGLAWVSRNNIHEYIDHDGETVIQIDLLEFPLYADKYLERVDQSESFKFSSAFAASFSEGLAPVEHMGKDGYPIYGYIDKTGEIVIEPLFYYALNFKEGYAPIAIRKEGIPQTLWGFIDNTGRIAVEPSFNLVSSFSEGLAHCTIWDDGDASWHENLKHVFVNVKGEFVIPPEFDDAGDFSEGSVWVKVEEKYGYIDKTGKITIKPQFNNVGDFSEGMARVNVGKSVPWVAEFVGVGIGKWGYINKLGKFIVEPKYHLAGDFSGGFAAVKLNKKWGFIDTNGKLLTKK